jgi:hypothetical protein
LFIIPSTLRLLYLLSQLDKLHSAIYVIANSLNLVDMTESRPTEALHRPLDYKTWSEYPENKQVDFEITTDNTDIAKSDQKLSEATKKSFDYAAKDSAIYPEISSKQYQMENFKVDKPEKRDRKVIVGRDNVVTIDLASIHLYRYVIGRPAMENPPSMPEPALEQQHLTFQLIGKARTIIPPASNLAMASWLLSISKLEGNHIIRLRETFLIFTKAEPLLRYMISSCLKGVFRT